MSKKLLLAVILFLGAIASNAQVFSTSATLKKGSFSVGIHPTLLASGSTHFILFARGGYGLTKGIDLDVKLGVLGPGNTYVGADIEFAMNKYVSVSAGAHNWGTFGLDGSVLATFAMRKNVNFYTGLDADINFADDVEFPLWLPLGFEIGLKKGLSFMFEADVNLTNNNYHLISGGVNLYF